jgi:lysophospholipase L1-like esterase
MLAVGTYAVAALLAHRIPPLRSFASVDAARIPQVWEMPIPEPPKPPPGPTMAEMRSARDQALAPDHLSGHGQELDHFYEALYRGRIVRVLHYGDSPTTGDLITADVRALLQKQFGDAGAGFTLLARPWAWYNHRGVGMETSGDWQIEIAGIAERKDGMYGPGGARFRGKEGSEALWTLKLTHQRSAEVAYLSTPEGGTFEFEADGAVVGNGDTKSDQTGPGFVTFSLPPGATEFKLRVTRGSPEFFGVEFRKDRAGVIYSSLGVNGAGVTLLSRSFSRAHLAAQLQHYWPDLVVLAYGTNESGFPEFVDSTWGSELELAIKRVRAAVPKASILLMSPMDRGEVKEDGQIGTIDALPRLVAIEERVAAQQGVAFFNTFEAMGGSGTMARWYAAEPRLVGADYIHPLAPGAKMIGELLYSALRDGYNEYKLRRAKLSVAASPDANPAP